MLGNLAVAKSKTIQKDKNDHSSASAGAASTNVSKPEAQAVTPAPPVRKPLGAKEPIPFQWKLMGKSHGFLMTLFKSIERDEVEAQYERVLRDGYYKDVEIVDISAKIQQTKAAKAALSAQRPAKKTTKPEKTRAPKFASVMRIKSAAPVPKASAKRATRKRTSAAKPAKKTKSAVKSTRKTATKKTVTRKVATRKSAAKKKVKAKATKTRKTTRKTSARSVAKSATKTGAKKTTKRVVKKKKKK